MSVQQRYVLDANAFIQPKRRFYPFDVCPGYWDALIWHQAHGQLCSIDRVKDELERGGDDLAQWVSALPVGFFFSTNESAAINWFGQMVVWAQQQAQFFPQAKADFANGVDGWLVAYAKSVAATVVTLEEHDPFVKRRIPIPNVCQAFAVDCVSPFEMLRAIQARFTWQAPT
jgi:uncharacterized protein DUF4411